MLQADLTRIAELTEAELNLKCVTLMSERGRAARGMTGGRIGGGVSLVTRSDPSGGYWNKTLGLGFTEPVTEKLIGEVIDFHREQGSPSARLQIAPEVLPADWDDICSAYGLTPAEQLVKLACRIEDFKPGGTDLRVGPVGVEDAEQWAKLLFDIFGMPEHFDSIFAAGVRSGEFLAFAAWDGDEMVAGANLYLNGEVASLNSGATRESHRRRGLQTALVAARAEAAAAAGCRWLVSETGKPAEGTSNPSLNNMIRSGLTPLYDRRSWVWQPENAAVNA
ncbi:GNAT family N-acetyltransferase [Micromonospora sp. NPDC050397]|uniref:GNAT family N-acetyltransferase n=1 Tax=Micromonospora sp. NPDC050397 TaxID=3364279 RepID=UPI003850AD50